MVASNDSQNAADTPTDKAAGSDRKKRSPRSPGFWLEAWRQFRRRKLAMVALAYVVVMAMVALFAPAIAGTRPVICKYKGRIYFPALAYLNPSWENPVFARDRFRRRYPENLKKKDPNSWAVWPLVFQDPYRRVRDGEWEGQPGNPSGADGKPKVYYLCLKATDSVFGTDHVAAQFGADPEAVPHNWLGTDQSGVDVFAQIVHGTRIAMLVGFVSMGIAGTIGIIIGALAGYFGGVVDMVLSRLIEVVMCIPTLVLILALLAVLERPTIWHTMVILGVTYWTGIARLTRAEFLRLKEMEYVVAAKALGIGRMRIMFRHILHNALAPVLVPITFGIAAAILIESGLSFLGFGAPPPNPSWGTLLESGRQTIEYTWWLILFPGIAIFITVLAYNLIGEGIQASTDPRLREGTK